MFIYHNWLLSTLFSNVVQAFLLGGYCRGAHRCVYQEEEPDDADG